MSKIAYPVRLMVTVRACCETTVEAASWDEAVKAVEALDPDDFTYEAESEGSIEGDPVAFLRNTPEADDYEPGADEVEFDIRPDGEPFSWDAVRIVKELAALYGDAGTPPDADAVKRLISEAHRACTKITGGMEG